MNCPKCKTELDEDGTCWNCGEVFSLAEEPVKVEMCLELPAPDPIETARKASLKILEHDNERLRVRVAQLEAEGRILEVVESNAKKEMDRLNALVDALTADAKAREGMIQTLYEPGEVVRLVDGKRDAVVREARIGQGKQVKYVVSYWSSVAGEGFRRTALVHARELADGDTLKPRPEPLVKDTAGMGINQDYEARP